MKRLLVLCVATALFAVPTAWASNNSQPLAFLTSHAAISQAVSQQPGVVNSTRVGMASCIWDVNDFVQRDALLNSVLDAGHSASDSVCVEADSADHVTGTQIAASSPNMVLTISFSTGGSSQVVPVFDKTLGLWVYRSCFDVPTYQPGDPLLQPIAGSNGGLAVPTTVSLSASNPTSRQITKIRYYWGVWPGTC